MGLFKDRVRVIVPTIPVGKVLDYTSVARLAGSPGAPKSVGPCMGPPGETSGWHRVVNNKGQLTSPNMNPPVQRAGFDRQRNLLDKDGVELTGSGTVDLSKYLWNPPDSTAF